MSRGVSRRVTSIFHVSLAWEAGGSAEPASDFSAGGTRLAAGLAAPPQSSVKYARDLTSQLKPPPGPQFSYSR
jgi:hypothetical protein